MFKKKPKEKSRIKTVKVTTEIAEHICSSECFKESKKLAPKGLKKISLGFIYQDKTGRFYHPWKDGDWLEIMGVKFLSDSSRKLTLLFEPTHQLHIHSPGGKTIEKTVRQKNVRVDENYHATEAAKKLKRKNTTRKVAQEIIYKKVAEVIPRAAKHKNIKGTGRGAPGQPRTALGKEIVRLIGEALSEKEILERAFEYAKQHNQPIAGQYSKKIIKQIRFWMKKVAP